MQERLTNFANESVGHAPWAFAFDLFLWVLAAGGTFLIVNGLLSGLFKGRRIRERILRDGQLRREILTSLRSILVFSAVTIFIMGADELGLLQLYGNPAKLGWPWFAASVVILIIGQDAWFYWTHRMIHHPKLFRKYHRIHHMSHNPTPFTSYAFDWEEAFINAIYLVIAAALIPVSFVALIIFMVHMIVRNAIGHSGYEVMPRNRDGKPLLDWVNTVTHHDLHHAEAGYNYGLYFTWWDRWMGTEHPEYHARYAKAVQFDRVLERRQAKADRKAARAQKKRGDIQPAE